MKRNIFADKEHDLSGYAALDFSGRDTFDNLAMRLTTYNPERFEAVALRLFAKKGEPIITLYAIDKQKQESGNVPKGKLPVRKFKLQIPLAEFLKSVKQFDFTVSAKDFDLKKILVENK